MLPIGTAVRTTWEKQGLVGGKVIDHFEVGDRGIEAVHHYVHHTDGTKSYHALEDPGTTYDHELLKGHDQAGAAAAVVGTTRGSGDGRVEQQRRQAAGEGGGCEGGAKSGEEEGEWVRFIPLRQEPDGLQGCMPSGQQILGERQDG